MLNINDPTDNVLVSNIPSYIRANREAINALTGGSIDLHLTTLNILVSTTTLAVNSDLSPNTFEYAMISAESPEIIDTIINGAEGQMKILAFMDDNLSFTDGDSSGGKLLLNQLPAYSTYNFKAGDILALINIGGSGDGCAQGYWRELWRAENVAYNGKFVQ